ncbi:complex I subunit 4 family protein [Mucilaginibacter pedocola]|uniref:NADH dehydrogenase n=1 Tax=Mucilaginibacter pedocola TaxID=1792845 RepID=A0A1S9P9M8_9SPHI|nr:NADH-quinone oxidoreductase subunit M [Mucilaginibacter pedocola]OOQ57684.1 NADH dehydrogenase [Mucilaginibacter pedocola]
MTVSILIFLPVIAAVLTLLFKNEMAKHAAMFFAVAELATALYFLSGFVADASLQYSLDVPWVPQFGIYFKAGIDGISMIMVLLTTVLVPLIILTTYEHEYKNARAFYALILFMQAGMLTVFTALDGFLFYVGWEAALIPIYFICALWGGENRIRVNIKFFIYTFAGSIFMLIGIIYLYLQTPTKDYDLSHFYNLTLDASHQGWVFGAFFLAFAIKMPIFPFHTWQPDTYTTAPSAGTMMLSGIMLKMGIYGVLRWLIPNAPIGFLAWGNWAIVLSVIGIVYASIIAFKQTDGKRLVAYSSIAHVGLIAAGIFAWNIYGVQGAMIQMISHGINVVGMFFIWDIISRRLNTRDISQLGGIAKIAPKFAITFLIVVLGTVALPLTNGFVGEFLLLRGVLGINIFNMSGIATSAIAGTTIILGAVYMLRMYKNVMQGELNETTSVFTDIKGSERLALGIICALIIVIGVYPQPLLHISEASVTNLIETVSHKFVNAKF